MGYDRNKPKKSINPMPKDDRARIDKTIKRLKEMKNQHIPLEK